MIHDTVYHLTFFYPIIIPPSINLSQASKSPPQRGLRCDATAPGNPLGYVFSPKVARYLLPSCSFCQKKQIYKKSIL